MEQRPRGITRWSYWLKWLLVADVDQQIILAQKARAGPWCDCRSLPGLVDAAQRVAPLGLVLADAEFDTEQNHVHIRRQLGARSIIPAKRGRSSRVGIRGQMRRAFPQRLYRQRAKIETVISVVKRKLSARAPGRSLSTQIQQALLLGLSFNLYRLRHLFSAEDVNRAILNFNSLRRALTYLRDKTLAFASRALQPPQPSGNLKASDGTPLCKSPGLVSTGTGSVRLDLRFGLRIDIDSLGLWTSTLRACSCPRSRQHAYPQGSCPAA